MLARGNVTASWKLTDEMRYGCLLDLLAVEVLVPPDMGAELPVRLMQKFTVIRVSEDIALEHAAEIREAKDTSGNLTFPLVVFSMWEDSEDAQHIIDLITDQRGALTTTATPNHRHLPPRREHPDHRHASRPRLGCLQVWKSGTARFQSILFPPPR